MLSYQTPGVYFDYPRPRPAVRPLATDVAGFVGIAERGPLHHPVEIESWPQFEAIFGGYTPQGYLAYAVQGFFANGGQTCWVVRVADPAKARSSVLDLVDADGNFVRRLVTVGPGAWGESLAITAVGLSGGRFSLVVRLPSGSQEVFADLALDPSDQRFVGTVLNDPETGSRQLRACSTRHPSVAAGMPTLPVLPGRLITRRPAGGTDGLTTLTIEHFDSHGSIADPIDPCAAEGAALRPMGLAALEAVDAVSLVAIPDLMPKLSAPFNAKPSEIHCERLDELESWYPPPSLEGVSEMPPHFDAAQIATLQRRLVAHCERLGDRVALLEVPPQEAGETSTAEDAMAWRQGFDSTYAALYFPWVRVPDPLRLAGLLRDVPPTGHVAGVIARSDLTVGVHKPPANALLRGVDDLVFSVDERDHGVLNQRGVNVIRPYLGRGIRLAGARTMASDPLWRFLNVRRLLIMIREAIDEQTQWTVFEPTNANLWQEIDRVARSFLLGLWRRGMLDGATADEAFSVKCDAATNPPEESEQGQLVCEVGVNPPWPAEFVVVRIRKTEGGIEILDTEVTRRG